MTEEKSCTLIKTDEFQSEFTFTLRQPIKYHGTDGGAQEEAHELRLQAPSNKQRHQTAALRQGFLRAVHYGQQRAAEANNIPNITPPTGNNSNKDQTLHGPEILSAVMMSNVDFVAYQETFRILLLGGVAFLNDGQKLTSPLYDQMSDEDTINLMGEYIAIFLISSLMKSLQ